MVTFKKHQERMRSFMSSDLKPERQEVVLSPLLSQSLSVLLNRAAQHSRDLFNQCLQPLHLTSKGFAVLSVLQEGTACSQIELGKGLGIDRTTMVSVIDELESQHFVERTRHPTDRRQHLLVLTPQGRDIYQQARQAAERFEDTFLAPLTSEQQQQLRTLLHLLTHTEHHR
jgi:DNA-binding MarR family transcriptional regulator